MSHPPHEGQTAVFLNSTSKTDANLRSKQAVFLNPSRFKALILDVVHLRLMQLIPFRLRITKFDSSTETEV